MQAQKFTNETSVHSPRFALRIAAAFLGAALIVLAGAFAFRLATDSGSAAEVPAVADASQSQSERQFEDFARHLRDKQPTTPERPTAARVPPAAASTESSGLTLLSHATPPAYFSATGTCYGDRVYSAVRMGETPYIPGGGFYVGGSQNAASNLILFKYQASTGTWVAIHSTGWLQTQALSPVPLTPTVGRWFSFPSTGYYRGAVQLYWYADANHNSAYFYDWVSHYDSTAGGYLPPHREYCTYTMPSGPLWMTV